MTRSLHLDFETRSACDLRTAGAYVYFDDPTTGIWCMAYALDDEPVDLWIPGEPCPADVAEHIASGGRLVAHNAAFERLAFIKIMGPRYGWPVPRNDQWHCTMAMALAQALPAGLEDVATVLRSPVQKDAVGGRLMKQMARPRKIRGDDGLHWWGTPDRLPRLYAYCRQDVEAEREVEKRLLPLSEREQALWVLDQEINDRGVGVDAPLCSAALRIVDEQRERLDRRMREVTAGEVVSTTAVAQIKAYLRDRHGINVDDGLAKDVVAALLIRDDLPVNAREVLELRKEGSRSSVSKIDALLNGMQNDSSTRGLLQFHAASTGRWGGRRFQPQNIKRPDLDDVGVAISAVATGNLDVVIAMFDDALSAIGDCLRGMVRARPGKVLCTADYANIEGRVLAWLAGEHWKIEAFRDYDAGRGPDLYKLAYGRSFQIDPAAVTKPQRQVGKVMELALGYQGGVGAFQTMAAGYGVRIGEQYDFLVANAPESVLTQVDGAWRSRGKSSGIEHETWVSAEIVKVLWRANHPATVQLWRDMKDAAIAAVKSPGMKTTVGPIAFRTNGSFLFMRLPSGRLLSYAFPRVAQGLMPWTGRNDEPVYRDQLRFKGVDSTTKQWHEQSTYGGSLTENAVQAIARDILAEAMPRVEAAGFPIVLTVHDEAVAEIDEERATDETLAEFERLLCELSPWAEGLPVVSEGWIGERYRK